MSIASTELSESVICSTLSPTDVPRRRAGRPAATRSITTWPAGVVWAAVATDYPVVLTELDRSLTSIESVLDPESKRAEIAELEKEVARPDLWDDQENAQKVTSRLSMLQGELERVGKLRSRLDDVQVLIELAQSESDSDSLAEADQELKSLQKAIDSLEVRTLLNGEYDQRDALVTIRSEAGGVDAADFAAMLLRMYLRWAERHHYSAEVYDTSYAEEAGIKSATFAIKAPYAYGTLSVEQGTHRLVRISPFDNQGRRQTSFAGVEVLPVTEQADHIDIPEGDIRVDVFRSSGPGGQSVNTTDSAVRITHLPSGIVVSCQNEKSQLQNKAAAMQVLQAKLLERARQEREAEMNALKGDGGNSWGAQMRSYVLHPYQMVKDLRTNYEVSSPDAVFDGEIDDFLDAGVRWRRTQEVAA
ncbi:peptide chain release factor 2 [Microlunatus elymi]|uniref:Peptide chain release factor 2 n=1 Tax=Microlunatus elymi TaxID=2596828 RepID=A0A516Q1Z0_9ACTN|nr:peptide chain release factor 2 [Microlunatus elymi]